TFFIVSGNPDGFSILWVCLLPACGLLTFGRKGGTLLCLGMLAILLFFLETPWGLGLLQYQYSPTFRMRFPLLYIAFYFASLLLESIRLLTHKKLIETQELYRYLYAHDALTKLYNRHGFNERMDRFFSAKQKNLALIILDIDHFKTVNDLHGHLTGDAVLQCAGSAIAEAVAERGCVCRWGGEEFAVLIPDCGDLSQETETLLSAIRAVSVPTEHDAVAVTVSIDAALACRTECITAVQLVNAADACLYRAKERGRDRAEQCVL
ncbi:MAG: GGDEF domain-containing protein, partial [Clostridiaceae bacterium]